MDYATAQKWVAALNAYNNGAGYLGHNDWQFPAAPMVDVTCANTGPDGAIVWPSVLRQRSLKPLFSRFKTDLPRQRRTRFRGHRAARSTT